MSAKPITIGDVTVGPGEQKTIELPAVSLYTQNPINIPIHIINGKEAGPRLFITAALHGDEINGVEIIRRLIRYKSSKNIAGTIIAIPVANIHGFISLSRYLPDRRDLNRSFPGSKTGSLAARLAYLFMQEIIQYCDYGIDLHTGNIHSENIPHVRINLDVKGALEFARAFNVPVILSAKLRDGSLRQAASELNIPMLVYEAGEALRFNEFPIRIGLRGIFNILDYLDMLKKPPSDKINKIKPRVSTHSKWMRSPKSGIFISQRHLGTDIEKGEKLGYIADPFSKKQTEIFSQLKGIIIGKNTLPLVNEGDALVHVARIQAIDTVSDQIKELKNEMLKNPAKPL